MHIRTTLFLNEDAGQDLIEYALLAALIGLGAVASVGSFSTALQGAITSITSSFQSAV